MSFERTEKLYGQEAMNVFKNSRVAVIGIGGVGGYAAEALVRSGIGSVIIVDHDKIETSNINRQIWAVESTVGKLKVEVAEKRLLDINPDLKIQTFAERFSKDTAKKILASKIDFVVDAIDSSDDKIELLSFCVKNKIPVISCMGAARRKDPTKVKYGTMSIPTGCPLARKIRRGLRKNGIEINIPIVFSEENPVDAVPGEPLPSCCAVPAAGGLAAAAYVCECLSSRQVQQNQFNY